MSAFVIGCCEYFLITVTGTGEIQIKSVRPQTATINQVEASITLNAVTRPTPPPTKYLVTINGGTGGGEYAEGVAITITAAVPDGQRFTCWTVNEGGVTLANASSTTTTFTMPAQAVTITANFENIPRHIIFVKRCATSLRIILIISY